ncbi:MAG: hypothetical protein LBP40_03610 [Campylobacteraceae bacterium]|nr:hypothetical protein [Campylobacteraceae bacterium]
MQWKLSSTRSCSKNAAKRAELQADFDKKLIGAREHIKNMTASKQKRITEMEEQQGRLESEIIKTQKELKDAEENLKKFEDEDMNDKGEIISDFEELC